MEIRKDIKQLLKGVGKSGADLSRELDMNYDLLNAYLNGRKKMPRELDTAIEAVIEKWAYDIQA